MSFPLDKYTILCTRMVWASSTQLEDVNIFSDVQPLQTLIIDLKPYLVEISDITWNLDTTDEEDGKSNLYFEESDVRYKLSGIVNNDYLVDFFGLYRNTSYEKYIIEIKEISSGQSIHKGIVSQELIRETFAPEEDSQVIEVTALGFLKEFKAWFKNKELLHNDTELIWEQVNPSNILLRDSFPRWRCSLQSLVNQTFNGTGVNFILEDDVSEWYIIKNPFLGKRVNHIGKFPDNTCWIKSSYERIRANGENRFDFIRRLCNSMGWIFYFSDNNFYIKNRSPIETPFNLDWQNVIEYTLFKEPEAAQYENVMIIDGDFSIGLPIHEQGWGHWDGARLKLFSNSPTVRYDRWWKDIPDDWDLIQPGVNPDINFRGQKYYNEDSTNFRYAWIGANLGGFYISNIFSLSQNNILRIDAGDTGSSAWGYDTDSGGITFPREFTYDPGEDEIQFKGCYGQAMFKLVNNHPWTYWDYIDTDVFFNNFQKFRSNNLARKISITYNGLISNPLQKYTFINNAPIGLAGEWTTVSLKINLLDKTSTLELQLKETLTNKKT